MSVEVLCPLNTRRSLRYRISLADGDDQAAGFGTGVLRGVVYAGSGNDDVTQGDRVYGGDGHDELEGARIYGGRGNDGLDGEGTQLNVLRGGPGDDTLVGSGWLYGGTGNDFLLDSPPGNPSAVPDMLIGGPGRDDVGLQGRGRTVVRLRGGGSDSVGCDQPASHDVVMFLDRSDRINRDCGRSARVLYAARPRAPR